MQAYPVLDKQEIYKDIDLLVISSLVDHYQVGLRMVEDQCSALIRLTKFLPPAAGPLADGGQLSPRALHRQSRLWRGVPQRALAVHQPSLLQSDASSAYRQKSHPHESAQQISLRQESHYTSVNIYYGILLGDQGGFSMEGPKPEEIVDHIYEHLNQLRCALIGPQAEV